MNCSTNPDYKDKSFNKKYVLRGNKESYTLQDIILNYIK